MIIFKEFTFDSAHFLPHVPEGHKCARMHGHTYTLTVYLEGELTQPEGWVMDFNELKQVVDPLIRSIDHRLLNDIPGLENPTSEVLVSWVWDRLKPSLPLLKKLELNETASSGVIYEGR